MTVRVFGLPSVLVLQQETDRVHLFSNEPVRSPQPERIRARLDMVGVFRCQSPVGGLMSGLSLAQPECNTLQNWSVWVLLLEPRADVSQQT